MGTKLVSIFKSLIDEIDTPEDLIAYCARPQLDINKWQGTKTLK